MATIEHFLHDVSYIVHMPDREIHKKRNKGGREKDQNDGKDQKIQKGNLKKHTTPGIRWSSPTQLLIQPSMVYVQGSGRDPQLSIGYGRMY